MNSYLLQRLALKNGQIQPPKKEVKPIAKKSVKKIQEEKDSKPEKELLDEWFADRRKELTGTCACGCGEPSQKKDDTFFRGSICHILPKSKFRSVAMHPMNFVERAMFGGCHSQMDDRSIDNWPGMEDWDNIVYRFNILEPLLTKAEKATKFYNKLKELVDKNTFVSVATHDKESDAVIVEKAKI